MDQSIGKSRWLRVSTLVAGIAVFLSACGGSSTTGQTITNGGTLMTADDVVMTVNMQNNPALDTDAAFDWSELDNVAKVDANTVKFTLKDAFAPFLANNLTTFIAPASVYGKIDPAKQRTDPVSLNPTVTGGAYKFDKRVAGSEIDYVANTSYYLGRPHY